MEKKKKAEDHPYHYHRCKYCGERFECSQARRINYVDCCESDVCDVCRRKLRIVD